MQAWQRLDAESYLILSKPFHDWNKVQFQMSGLRFHLESPHESQRVATNLEQDQLHVLEVEKLISELVYRGVAI